MSLIQRPSKKIIIMIAGAVIVIGAISVNKFWPYGKAAQIVTPSYSAPDLAQGEMPKNSIDGTAFLQQFATSSAATSTDNTPASASREIARTLFANTAYLESTNSLDDTSKAAMVQNAISQLQNSFSYKQYDPAGLSYIGNENPGTIRFFASSFATLQIGLILTMQSNVAKIETNLGVLGDIYAEQAKEIYTLKIPRELASVYLQIINNFSKSAAAFKSFANDKNDPISVPIAMRAYQDASSEQEVLLRQVAQYIKANGIMFTSDEAGGYWNAFQ